MKKLSWFIFLAIIAFSCLDEPDCFQLNNDIIGISFRVLGSSRADTTRITHLDYGSKVHYIADTTSIFWVNMNYLAQSMDLTFEGPVLGTKVMHLDYHVQTQFVSDACGSRFVLSGLKVPKDRTDFDSVRVVASTPGSATGGVNVEVYRCPDPKNIGVAFYQLYMDGTVIAPANRKSKAISADLGAITVNGQSAYTGGNAALVYLPVDLTSKVSEYTFNFTANKFAPTAETLRITYDFDTLSTYGNICPANKQYPINMRINKGVTSFDSASFYFSLNNNTGLYDTLNRALDPVETNVRIYRCPETNLMQIAFRTKNASGSSNITDTVAVQSITVDYMNTVLYSNVSLSYAQIPLNPNATQTTVTVKYDDTRNDVFTVTYTSASVVLFPRCGSQLQYTALVLPDEAASDSINITTDKNVKYPPVSNVEIVH